MGFVYMGSMWLGDTIVIEAFDMNFRSSLLFCLNAKSENKSITQKIFLLKTLEKISLWLLPNENF